MKKILYVSVHSEGFGDGVANLRYISSLKQFVNEPVISHGLIHRKSSNLYSFLIEDMGLMDKIYTHDSIDNFEIILTSELKNIKYDYIFLSEIGENFLTNCEHYINVLNNILNKDGMIYYKIWNKDTSSWAESPYKGYLSSNSNTNGDANTIVVWSFCPDYPKWEEASKRALQTRRKKNRKSRKRRNP